MKLDFSELLKKDSDIGVSSEESSDSDQDLREEEKKSNKLSVSKTSGKTYITRKEKKIQRDNSPNLKNILLEINKKIDQGEKIELSKYPSLFVVHYRGINFFRQFFNQEKRRQFRSRIKKNKFNSDIFCPAVYEKFGKGKKDESGFKILEKKGQAISFAKEIKKELKTLSEKKPIFTSNKGREYANPLYPLYQRYVNNYEEFRKELSDKKEEFYKELKFNSNPFVSTADEPKHAIFYALGGKATLEQGVFRPSYYYGNHKKKKRAKHPKVGYVQIVLHELGDFIQQAPLMLSSLHAYNAIDIKHRTLHERETTFLGYIPKKNIAYAQIMRFPSFNIEYNTRIEKKYGLSKESFNTFKRNFEKKPKNSSLLEKIEEHYTKELEKKSKELIDLKNGFLVYIGLDGKLYEKLPRTDIISGQRTQSKRKKYMDSPIYKTWKISFGDTENEFDNSVSDDEFESDIETFSSSLNNGP